MHSPPSTSGASSPEPGGAAADAQEYSGVLAALWGTRAWRLLALLLVHLTGLLLLAPVLPGLFSDFFASRRAGAPVRCGGGGAAAALPAACQDAHADVVLWSTTSGFLQNCVVAALAVPALGAWSDVAGRRPYLLAAQAASAAPVAVVGLHLARGLPLLYYYPVSVLAGAAGPIAPALAYLSDAVPRRWRAASFGLIMAAFSVAVLVGPTLGALVAARLPPAAAPALALGAVAAAMLLTFFWLPESLPPAAAAEAAARRAAARAAAASGGARGPLAAARRAAAAAVAAVAVLRRSPLFRRLAAVLMLSAAVGESMQDILTQYLQLKLDFRPADIGHLFLIYGAGALLVQAVLLRALLAALGEARLLAAGLAAYAAQNGLLAFAPTKGVALLAVGVGALGSVAFPAAAALQANGAAASEQGQVQGALYGARAFAGGAGPLLFGAVFAAFSRTGSPLPYAPGAVFALGSLAMVAAVALAAGLPADGGGRGGDVEAAEEEKSLLAAERAAAAAAAAELPGRPASPLAPAAL